MPYSGILSASSEKSKKGRQPDRRLLERTGNQELFVYIRRNIMSAVVEIVEKIEKLTLLEAVELKKALEDKFGVTAAAPVMMGGMMPAAGGAAPATEEKTEFTVLLKETGAQKINVIKVVRAATG